MPWLPNATASSRAVRLLYNFPSCNKRFVSSNSLVEPNIAAVFRKAVDGKTEPQVIDIVGHVRTIRNQKRRSFLELGDGSTTSTLQALLSPEQAAGIQTGTAVKLSGLMRRCPPGKEQSHELNVEHIEILGPGNAEAYPIQKKYHTPEYLRTLPHLRLRVPLHALLARLRSECDYHIGTYFREHDFIQVHPPTITSSDCEGGGEVFSLQPAGYDAKPSAADPDATHQAEAFFGGPKYLTVSSQLHLEAYVHEHHRVWTSSPAFRAEKSDTPRHLSEFFMVEAELRTNSLDDVMNQVEGLIGHVVTGLRESSIAAEIFSIASSQQDHVGRQHSNSQLLEDRWHGLRKQYWPRITYGDAVQYLQSLAESSDYQGPTPPLLGAALQLEHERLIAAEIGQGSPVFVTHYPRHIKPFYMLSSRTAMEDHSQESTVACFDLLLPEMSEIVGGSLREHDLVELQKSMQCHGLIGSSSEEEGSRDHRLQWYLDLRRYGSVPHGGFGLGLDRLVGYLTGVDNLKDVVAWPRYHGRCDG